MKKLGKALLIMFLGFMIITLNACVQNESGIQLTEEEKTSYTEKAQKTIEDFNNSNTEAIKSNLTEEMASALNDETLKQIYGQIQASGAFEKFENQQVTTVVQGGKNYIIVVQKAKYANNSLTYTISFDEQGRLAGLYYK